MDQEVIFELFKNVIMKQNEKLLECIARDFKKHEHALRERYLKPDYYLPIICPTKPTNIVGKDIED